MRVEGLKGGQDWKGFRRPDGLKVGGEKRGSLKGERVKRE